MPVGSNVPVWSLYYGNIVYQHVTGWESFEPVLSRAEQMDQDHLWKLAQGMPKEWWNPTPFERIQWAGSISNAQGVVGEEIPD